MSFIYISRKELEMQYVNPLKAIRITRLLMLLMLISFILQLIIISYNQFTGYIQIKDGAEYLTRLVYSTFLSFVASNLLVWPNLLLINWLNRKIPWSSYPLFRILIEFFGLLLIGVSIATAITLIAHTIDEYEQSLGNVLFNNVLIVAVVNLIFMVAIEAWLFFKIGREEERRYQVLKQELERIKFEVLKDQLKPHFMFNSLNVLSGLIDENTERAQDFISEFAQVYRYVLETIEKNLVSVNEELDFIKSYIFLQQVRYGKMLQFYVDVSEDINGFYLPPLSLQVVLENAIKHNNIDDKQPLKIHLFNENDFLIIKNNLQPKAWKGPSTGVGQKNLVKRFEMVSDKMPVFIRKSELYIVKIPLIKAEKA